MFRPAGAGGGRADDTDIPIFTSLYATMYNAGREADGALLFSSLAAGRVFRAALGASEASEWIKQGTNGLDSTLGVLADEKSGTLYVCSVDLSGGGIVIPTGATPGALKAFDLKTGAPKGSATLPPSPLPKSTPLCNDIAV